MSVTESVISDLLPVASQKRITLDVHSPETTPNMWVGDPVRIRQIIMNLVSNSVKFTEKGGVKVEINESTPNDKNGILISVTDTGIGMSKEAVNALFDRFTQADSSITRKFGGTGLGMSITHSLVELMGGNIKIVSTEGKGTKFVVFLPLERSTLTDDNSRKSFSVSAPNLKGVRILVAEDNSLNQEIVRSMLEPTEATVVFAENGIEAVELFYKHGADIILMDIQMPLMDGKQAFIKIREQGYSVPVFALTANVMTSDIAEYRELGFTGHIGKPFDIAVLYSEISKTLKNLEE